MTRRITPLLALPLLAALLLVALLLAPAALPGLPSALAAEDSADAASATAPAEALPPGAEVVELTVEPAAVELTSRYDYVQLLVTARLKSGASVDVTRLAILEGPPPLVSVSPTRLVRPQSDGQAELVFTLGGQTAKVPVTARGTAAAYEVDYIRDVQPVLSKLGCNAGTCHGSKNGKNGFKLSLRGYDALFDTRALTDDHGSRRINRASPENSLMLLKASGSVPHVGGRLTEPGEPSYEIIRSWIGSGAKLHLETPRVTGIEMTPVNPVVDREGMRQQMRIVATYADGTRRDVTAEAFIETGNQDVATTDADGVATALRRGEAPILARFEGSYAATTLTVMGDRSGFVWKAPATFNRIDELVAAKLERLKTLPGELCSDDEFLRRVYLDLTGLPPEPQVIRAFLADERETGVKRDEVIDRLVGNPEYVEHRTNKWADLLQVNRKFLGEEGAVALRNWIHAAVAENMPYDKFVYEILTASGSNRTHAPASYYKILRTPEETMENTTHLFLAVRFNCNKCHDHPFERWTQDQYYHLAAYFAQVGLKRDPASGKRELGKTAVERGKPLYEVVFDKGAGDVKHERTGEVAPPAFPYATPHEAGKDATRREQLARWLTSPENPYFARSYANRLWGYLLGVGIIEPIDDIRAGNPPTNPELLDWLTAQFVESGFDTRELIRTICKSRTYQLSVATNRWNEDDRQNFSHGLARRLPAEVLFDAVHRVTGATPKLPGMPPGMRAAQLPDVGVKLPSGFLDQFGRPARESSCECERASGLMLGPVMALINGPTIAGAIADPNNAISKLVSEEKEDAKLIDELFVRILNRPPTEREREAGIGALSGLEAEHQKLVATLAEYEKGMAARRAPLEAKRNAAIAQAEKDLAAYEQALPARVAAWEAEQSPANWRPLEPIEMQATNKAQLVKESDQSIFVQGPEGRGEYVVIVGTDLRAITGVRIEALTDKRLGSNGPGRAPNGNFVVSELVVEAAPTGDPEKFAPVPLENAQADFSQAGYDVATAIDGQAPDRGNGWAVAPALGTPHTAVFQTKADVGHEGGTRLRFKLNQQYFDGKHALGRFRLSVTDSRRPLQRTGPPAPIAAIFALPADKRNDQQRSALLAHFRGQDARHKALQAALAAAQQPVPADARLAQLRGDIEQSQGQLANQRLTGAQDVAWALINSPAFLFNR